MLSGWTSLKFYVFVKRFSKKSCTMLNRVYYYNPHKTNVFRCYTGISLSVYPCVREQNTNNFFFLKLLSHCLDCLEKFVQKLVIYTKVFKT